MSSRIPVATLGATGLVGQALVAMLFEHPWFDVKHLCASDRSAGEQYGDIMSNRWSAHLPLTQRLAGLKIEDCSPKADVPLAFSALGSDVAGAVEVAWAEAGTLVCTNASTHRMHKDVPLVVPEINADHLALLERQSWSGGIVANPNCSTVGLALSLAPLHRHFGLRAVSVTTLQALSGAGRSGVASLDIFDNCLPLIPGEEEKLCTEPLKILGEVDRATKFAIGATCHRVPVIDGHLLDVAVSLRQKASIEDVGNVMADFKQQPGLRLPSAPEKPLVVREEPDRPQPRLDRMAGGGMSVTIGRIRRDGPFDLRYSALVHNLIRGAAGAAILNAEALVRQGFIEGRSAKRVPAQARPAATT